MSRFSPWAKASLRNVSYKDRMRKTPDPNQADSQAHNPFLEHLICIRGESLEAQKSPEDKTNRGRTGRAQLWSAVNTSPHFPESFTSFCFFFCCSGLISVMKSNLSSSLCLHPIGGQVKELHFQRQQWCAPQIIGHDLFPAWNFSFLPARPELQPYFSKALYGTHTII